MLMWRWILLSRRWVTLTVSRLPVGDAMPLLDGVVKRSWLTCEHVRKAFTLEIGEIKTSQCVLWHCQLGYAWGSSWFNLLVFGVNGQVSDNAFRSALSRDLCPHAWMSDCIHSRSYLVRLYWCCSNYNTKIRIRHRHDILSTAENFILLSIHLQMEVMNIYNNGRSFIPSLQYVQWLHQHLCFSTTS